MAVDPPIILRTIPRRHRRGPSGPKGSALAVVLLLGAANFLFFFNDEATVAPPSLQERIQHPVPTAVPAAESAPWITPDRLAPIHLPSDGAPGQRGPQHRMDTPVDDFGEPVGRKVAGELRRGQTILKALRREGIDSHTALPLVHAMEQVFDFRQAQVGDSFQAWLDDDGQIQRFRYEQSPLDIYEIASTMGGAYRARKVAVPTRIEMARIACAIKSSLYESITRCGEGHQLGSQLIDLLAWDLDFFQDVRQGDVFRVSVEKISVNGEFLKYGRIRAAEYDGKFGQHRIVYYTDPEGNSGYFTGHGRAVRKEFLKSPLKYTRVSAKSASDIRTSGRETSSVVYTAEVGTPVWAVASGTVVHAGPNGKRRGLSVTIKHDNGYSSTYSHLSKVSAQLQVGAQVRQKVVIGYVGQTGQTREPKLRFSLRRNGKLINPLRRKFAEADPVPGEFRSHFDHEVQQMLRDLETATVIGIHDRRS